MTRAYFSLDELPLEQVTGQFSRRTLAGQQEMVIWGSMSAGARGDRHQHPHEQIFWIISGEMEFQVGDARKTCKAGDLILIHGGTEHELWCLEDATFVTILAPVRKDLLPGAGIPRHL